ncbi:DUF5343 domain-containing protein [Alteromonas sp. KUL49]|uniref:DUF5343 domain-containing protein n=1 Tax=Alteromonas sp. KUL49 TaxID=2480798 RepID=UPI00102F221A|nr:DUF5343 domain-containing protein [Alteromonas sp. KUL49]TAP41310.1 hypothetical protein EYS00_03715 [Alteromonas sp. KUL49]GEA10372.1 hypothetical protein KUL49_07470 [Alteromonas sp. KUL49]
MSLPSVYTQVYGQIPDFFSKLQEGQAPTTFTQQHLKDIGFASTNHRAFIPILKALGFLSPSGAPTSRYLAYRDKSQARQVMGEAIKDAYSDLFLIKTHPKEVDKELIEGKFKSTHNAKDRPAELMAKTFFGLLALADIDHSPKPQKAQTEKESEPKGDDTAKQPVPELKTQIPIEGVNPSLHYNIQIHLPATKDIEVYNSIFKSLKEHLLG